MRSITSLTASLACDAVRWPNAFTWEERTGGCAHWTALASISSERWHGSSRLCRSATDSEMGSGTKSRRNKPRAFFPVCGQRVNKAHAINGPSHLRRVGEEKRERSRAEGGSGNEARGSKARGLHGGRGGRALAPPPTAR